jgi:hypothetical protein
MPFGFATAGRILAGGGRAAELPEVLAGDIAAKAARSSSMQGNPLALSHTGLHAIVLQAL